MVVEEEESPITEPYQNIESATLEPSSLEPKDATMEEAPNQIVVSEASASHPIPVSLLAAIEQIKVDNAKVN